jgi:hypothetical protein
MPRWVKLFLIVAAVAALALLVAGLAGIQHGPDLHTRPSGSQGLPAWHGS